MGSTPPRIFANRFLKIVIEHGHGADIIIAQEDYASIRTAYRASGGSWEAVINGDPKEYAKLVKIVAAWAEMPERKRTGERFV